MNFKDLVKSRRSHRKFSGESVSPEQIKALLRAALMAPTSKCRRDWKFFVTHDKGRLRLLSQAKSSGAGFLAEADLAIAVCGNPAANDCWIEDCSIAAVSIQYQAEELGLGSCWAQMRGRSAEDGTPAEEKIRQILSLPDELSVLCVIGVGHKAEERQPQNEDKLLLSSCTIL